MGFFGAVALAAAASTIAPESAALGSASGQSRTLGTREDSF